jgi:predicted enzyme related to lactoylglutathione lyase
MSDKPQCSGTADMTPGIVSWNEIVSRDPDGTKKFYSQLFGWKVETMNMGPGAEYTMLKTGDRPAAGLIRMPAEAGPAPTMWMSYVTVADLPAAIGKARALGAKICKDVTTLPMGSFAIITDPQGATFGLWEFTK